MGFGFFKKNTYADIIFMNGKIYTQDPELPWTDAVACKDGKVLVTGNYEAMGELEGDDTEIYDLKGKYMFPGFIDAHSSTVLATFKDTYLELDPAWDLDTCLGEITNYCDDLYDGSTAFAYGFNESLLDDIESPEEVRKILDEVETDKPVVMLGEGGHSLLLNTVAAEIVKTICEDEGVEHPGMSFILDALTVFDPEELEENYNTEKERLTDKGYTAVFNSFSPSYFDNVYRSMLLERIGESDSINQKFYGSYFINRPVNPKFVIAVLNAGRTFCSELEGLIHFNFLKISAGGEENPVEFTAEYLNDLCLAVADKGYSIHIDAMDKETLLKAYAAFNLVRSKGYSKISLVIASDIKAEKEELEEFDYADTFVLTYGSDRLNTSVFSHSSGAHDAVDKLTTEAAAIIGERDKMGSIEKGKNADFTVFAEDILHTDLRTFSRLHADMTVIGGEIVYDVDQENYDEMVNLLMNMQV